MAEPESTGAGVGAADAESEGAGAPAAGTGAGAGTLAFDPASGSTECLSKRQCRQPLQPPLCYPSQPTTQRTLYGPLLWAGLYSHVELEHVELGGVNFESRELAAESPFHAALGLGDGPEGASLTKALLCQACHDLNVKALTARAVVCIGGALVFILVLCPTVDGSSCRCTAHSRRRCLGRRSHCMHLCCWRCPPSRRI